MAALSDQTNADSTPIPSKRPAIILCGILFFAAMLPFLLGLQAAQKAIHQNASAPESTSIVYDSTCNPFGALLTCVEVRSASTTAAH